MKQFAFAAAAAALWIGMSGAPAVAQDHVGPITEYVKANIEPWLADPIVVKAINDQNAAHAGLSQADIDELDKKWRAETEASSHPMIDGVLGNALSKFLVEKQAASGGMVTEIFVTDNKGLNVGQSSVTSDYWQGDEAKWEKSFGAGAGAVFVDEVEKDESTQTLQSQVSVAISDPATSQVIGAVTLGIDVGGL
jgi:opacity protein-like surface antigen